MPPDILCCQSSCLVTIYKAALDTKDFEALCKLEQSPNGQGCHTSHASCISFPRANQAHLSVKSAIASRNAAGFLPELKLQPFPFLPPLGIWLRVSYHLPVRAISHFTVLAYYLLPLQHCLLWGNTQSLKGCASLYSQRPCGCGRMRRAGLAKTRAAFLHCYASPTKHHNEGIYHDV